MKLSFHALFALSACFGLVLSAQAQPAPAAAKATAKATAKAKAKAQATTVAAKPPACTPSASSFTGTFEATKVTLIPVDKEEGGDCNQAHLWVDAVQIEKGKKPCSLAFGIYVGDASKEATAKKIAQLQAAPFKGSVDPAGMCYAEFSAR